MNTLPSLSTLFKKSLDPYNDYNTIQKEMDTIFKDVFSNWETSSISDLNGYYPKVDIKNKKDYFEIVAATPGMEKDNLKIEYKEGILTLRGESNQDTLDEGEHYICKELKKSSFVRMFKLDNSSLDIENISSNYKNGELCIIIPKIKIKEKENNIKTILIK